MFQVQLCANLTFLCMTFHTHMHFHTHTHSSFQPNAHTYLIYTHTHTRRGMNPQQAVKGFLRKVRDLETYGSIFYDVRLEADIRQLSISPTGVAVYRRKMRVFGREWPAVLQLSFKSKKFVVEVQQDIHVCSLNKLLCGLKTKINVTGVILISGI